MKTISAGLTSHYASGSMTLATCWKATLRDSTVVAATSHDSDIVFQGVTYSATAGYSATDVQSSSGMNPDNLEVAGFLQSPAITEDDVYSGRWDFAEIEIFEVNWADTTQGRRILRVGTLGEVKAGRNMFVAELRGLLQYLSRTIGRITGKECDADLGDARCKFNVASVTVTGTVGSVVGNVTVNDAARTETTNHFAAGKITFTSGLNNGLSMEIKNSTSGQLILWEPMPFTIAAGDTYSAYPGCYKRIFEDCRDKFNNVVNFRGFPFLPGSNIYKPGGQQ